MVVPRCVKYRWLWLFFLALWLCHNCSQLTVCEALSRKAQLHPQVPYGAQNPHAHRVPTSLSLRSANNKRKRHQNGGTTNPLLKTVMRIGFILLFASVIWGMLLILMHFNPSVAPLECNRTTSRHKWLLWNPEDFPMALWRTAHEQQNNKLSQHNDPVWSLFYVKTSRTKGAMS